MANVDAVPTPITPAWVPIIDPKTGLISQAWYLFFLSLFRAAEAVYDNQNNGPSAISLAASLEEALNKLAQEVQTQPISVFEQVQPLLEAIAARLDTLPPVQPDPRIDALQQELQTLPRPELGSMAPLEQDNLPWVTFNTAPSPLPTTVGTVAWDGGTTLGVQATTDVVIRVGEAEYVYVKASSGITKGELCYHTGSVGASGVITAAPTPLALTDPNQIVGVAAETIALNGFGLIQISGTLRGFNTTGTPVGETWADGDALYYNPAYVGSMTKVKPFAPNQKTYIGEVINAATAGSGSMSIRITPGSILGGTDANVQFGTLSDKDLIQYDDTLKYWKNVAASSIVVGTATNLAGGATGSVPYQSAANTTVFLPVGTAAQVLKVNSGATAPEWVSGAALTKSDDTNVTLTLGGSPTTALLAATSITAGWTGQLSLTRGGTNASLTASAGAVAYSTASALALNTAGNSGDWLKSGGTSAPAWTAPAALTKTDDTNVTLTLGGSASTALLNAASLTLGWTGQLDVSRGGTGLSSGTSGGIPYFSSTSAMTSSALLTANALMVGGGAGAAPSTVTTGTGVVTALGVNTGTAGAFVVNGGALGTPSSGTVTNLTGTASININGTVGATTANTGKFTSITNTGLTSGRVVYSTTGGLETDSANLTFDGTTLAVTGAVNLSNNLNFTSTAQRITGDMSNATFSNRLAFQTSTTNGSSTISILPNGTATATLIAAFNNSDPTNGSYTGLLTSSSECRLQAARLGTGTFLKLTFFTNGSEQAQIDTSGNFRIGTAALATTATNGFLYIPTCAGTPTGVPTAITGLAPLVIDSTNNKLYFYSGGAWRDAGP